jgi:hypothetical protein
MCRLYKYFTLDSIMYTFYVDLINDKQMCRHKCQWLLTIANSYVDLNNAPFWCRPYLPCSFAINYLIVIHYF